MAETKLDDGLLRIPLQQMVTFRIGRIHARISAQAANLLQKTAGISLMQWRVFVLLETHKKITPAEIVRLTSLDKGQLSRTIKKMVADGLISSSPSETDQRAQVIEYTEKGLALFRKARPLMRQRQRFLINSLSDEENDALFRALGKLDVALDALEDQF
jgi:DNA-binding MarR family transcriptional regulator